MIAERVRSANHVAQYGRALFWHAAKRAGLVSPLDTIDDQKKDDVAPFDEYPPCAACGGSSADEVLITADGRRIVECTACGLWFTSPRIRRGTWVEYLKSDSERSREFTENRLRYGVALSSNAKYAFPDWRNKRMRRDLRIIDEIEEHAVGGLRRVHDVGCGVGFFLEAARARGLEATGNELNGYAYRVMKERLGLDVYQEVLPELPLEENSLDAVTMNDYIEHTYDPLGDLVAAHRLLRVGGVLWLNTFHVDCLEFERLKANWNMLFWNHVYHFSTASLRDIIGRAGFDVRLVATSRDSVNIKVVARKDA